MFIRTYGPLYEKNAIIFTELFDKLEIYYRGNRGHVNLHSAINTFFSDLFKKMFALLNAQYTLDNTQLQCVSRHMDKVNPSEMWRRNANHTAVQPPPNQDDVLPAVSWDDGFKTLHAYCLSVTKSCLGQHIEMESEWNQYIDALLMLAERLRSPFNIETVITPIDVKISEAIMNLQEQGQNISNKIFLECGKPRLSKRAAPASRRNHNVSSAAAGGDLAATNHGGPVNLEQLSRDIKEKLIQSKDFWSGLPAHLCSDYGKTFKTPLQEDCWNGLTKSKTASSASEDAASGGGAPARLPKSAESDSPKPTASTAIVQQMHQLKLVTLKLKQAYNGMDVEWIETVSDDEDDTEEHSRTGSSPSHGHASDSSELGSGSGDRDPEITDEDEDDSAIIEGSGTPPPVPANPVTVIHIVHVTTTVAPPPAHHRGAKLHVISTPAPDFEFDSTTISTTTPQPPSVPPVSVTTTIPIPTTTTAQTVSLLPPKPTVRSSASVSVLPVSGICWTILFATLVWIGR
ncbi:Glypican-6 [Hypsibius exemplaris]|uniref:Glypican-6 n=1 Tax=Hypsibius exemplaris TaxID=2072580 RepID=A0A9X6RL34_HYPEX|nr:Glypican-6 [Hypsibius exemplaris]